MDTDDQTRLYPPLDSRPRNWVPLNYKAPTTQNLTQEKPKTLWKRLSDFLWGVVAFAIVCGATGGVGMGLGLVFVWSSAQRGDQRAIESLPSLVPAYIIYLLGYVAFVVFMSWLQSRSKRD